MRTAWQGIAPLVLAVREDADLPVVAVEVGRWLAATGASETPVAKIRTAVMELASNIAKYAPPGRIEVCFFERGPEVAVEVVAIDEGPGIPDVERALEDHFSTGGTLGLGLPGVRRLMDDFEVTTQAGGGTTIRVRHWLQ